MGEVRFQLRSQEQAVGGKKQLRARHARKEMVMNEEMKMERHAWLQIIRRLVKPCAWNIIDAQ